MVSFGISVPVGAYHPLLVETLKSLSVQSPRPSVALLDASGDERVAQIADRFDELLTYRRHGPDDGQSSAILEGWHHVRGDILGWLNADDALFPDALSVVDAVYEQHPETDVVYGQSTIIDDSHAVTGYHWAVEPPSDNIFHSDIISQPSCFFRRTAYEKAGGLDKELHYTMDWDLWIRLMKAGARFQFVDTPMSRVLWTRDAKTGGFHANRRREIDTILKAHAGGGRRLKSFIGFALHNLFEYGLPAQVSRRLRHSHAASGTTVCGLGRNGEIFSSARIYIAYFGDKPASKAVVHFSGNAEGIDVDVRSRGFAAKVDGSDVLIEFEKVVQSSDVVELEISAPARNDACFLGARLLGQ